MVLSTFLRLVLVKHNLQYVHFELFFGDSVGVGSSRSGLKSECADIFEQSFLCLLRCVKTDNKKRATCLAILLQNKFNSDVARFTTR